jgi:hypothetical protein
VLATKQSVEPAAVLFAIVFQALKPESIATDLSAANTEIVRKAEGRCFLRAWVVVLFLENWHRLMYKIALHSVVHR